MVEHLKQAHNGEHASNLGVIIADDIAKEYGIPAFTVDPVSVDEMDPIARISGMPQIERQSFFHALNHKAVGRKAATDHGKIYSELNLIIAHLGGGISVAVHRKGRVIDVNESLEGDGPMTPERSGGVPLGQLYRMCFSGKCTLEEIIRINHGFGGLTAYLGTNNAKEIVSRIQNGDSYAKLIYDAMIYQIAKEIGACATVLKGDIDYIVLTGGLVYESYLVKELRERVSFLGEVLLYPGEQEMLALAEGALRILNHEELEKNY
jgi:butyrate kinase